MKKYNFVHIVLRYTWPLCLQISPAIEKTRSDGSSVALTANMAFANSDSRRRHMATQLKK